MKSSIVLIGGGGHCKSCIDVIEQQRMYSIAGIVDLPNKKGERILGYDIIANDTEIPYLAKTYNNFLITIGHLGYPKRRIELFLILKQLDKTLPVIISPNSYVSRHAEVQEGTIVMHQAMINAGAKINKNCIINSKALVEHDAFVDDNCHISTNAIINGGVKIGKNSFFGSGAVSKQNITIPENSFIKANSIVK